MARNKAYQEAEEMVEAVRRSGAGSLDLSKKWGTKDDDKLTELPESMSQLTQLRALILSGNQLTALPDWVNQLTELRTLDISDNQLTALPEWLGRLTQLRNLNLSSNELTELPESLGQLIQLTILHLDHNNLLALPTAFGNLRSLKRLMLSNGDGYCLPRGSLPSSLANLVQLESLWAQQAGLERLPDWIGNLIQLQQLVIENNELSDLPPSMKHLTNLVFLSLISNRFKQLPLWIVKLGRLEVLSLEGNPLNSELASVYVRGLNAVKCYLLEIEKGGRHRYEAKLLILGDGNEGKTCVSRALRGLPFRAQKTTRGVEVAQWKFPHPDDVENHDKDVTLNIWDFEGQEITHQTHQFFLTSQALYLLVFKSRDQFLMDRAEYWLDTIRARAPQAKVVIVMSQCEERSPHIPLDQIEAQYGDVLAKEWFFAVGCANGRNIEKLQTLLRRSAVTLPFMGDLWPKTYEQAESEIIAKSKTAHIARAKLNGILKKAGVSEDNYEGAARAIGRIGAITQFPDCPELRDFVVLKPQWLTKAISEVMEDGQLSEDKGEISMTRMEAIWSKARYHGMFPTFHNCMKEFELCYDLEDVDDTCLVPLRFGYIAPAIPWTGDPGLKERRMEYKLSIRPPMGIMSRFIVKAHHMIVRTPEYPKGIYWHNGVFLRTKSPCPSEALCEFLPEERILRVRVRAAFPQNMCEQIHGYVQAMFSFFGGLAAERSYGCIKVDESTGAELQCKGLHTEKRIYTTIAKQRESLDCEYEEHEVDPRLLVSGISSFGGFVEERLEAIVRREIDKPPEWARPFLHGVGSLVEWVQVNSGKLDQLLRGQIALADEFKQEAELKLHEYLACMGQLLDDRDHTAAPALISINTKDRSLWNPVGYFKRTYVLTPFCECDGNIHACEDGSVQFTRDRAWWRSSAPWIARATKVLAAGLQLAFTGLPLTLGTEIAKSIENEIKFMNELTKHLVLEQPDDTNNVSADELLGTDFAHSIRPNESEMAITRAALARFLEAIAPNNYRARRWGSLSRVRMSDHSYRWLCGVCVEKNR